MTQFKTDNDFQFNTEELFKISLISDQREFKERKIDDALAWLAANNPNSSIKNFDMVNAHSEIKYFQERSHQLEQEREWMIHQRLFQNKRDVKTIEQTTVVDNFVGPTHQAEEERKKRIREEIENQEQICHQDVQLISGRYQTLIKQCQELLELSRKNYDTAYHRWCEEQDKTDVKSAN